jgi:hypothetical protein
LFDFPNQQSSIGNPPINNPPINNQQSLNLQSPNQQSLNPQSSNRPIQYLLLLPKTENKALETILYSTSAVNSRE